MPGSFACLQCMVAGLFLLLLGGDFFCRSLLGCLLRRSLLCSSFLRCLLRCLLGRRLLCCLFNCQLFTSFCGFGAFLGRSLFGCGLSALRAGLALFCSGLLRGFRGRSFWGGCFRGLS